jgi:hypothetical protein
VQRGPAPFTKFVLRDHLERGRGRTASCLEEELREVREDARGHRGPRNGGRTTVFAWALCAGPEHFMSVRRWLFLYLAPVFATRLGQMGFLGGARLLLLSCAGSCAGGTGSSQEPCDAA